MQVVLDNCRYNLGLVAGMTLKLLDRAEVLLEDGHHRLELGWAEHYYNLGVVERMAFEELGRAVEPEAHIVGEGHEFEHDRQDHYVEVGPGVKFGKWEYRMEVGQKAEGTEAEVGIQDGHIAYFEVVQCMVVAEDCTSIAE